jgi:hypothetical protein
MTEQTTETPVDAPDSPEQSDSEGLSPTPEGEGTGEAPKGNREAKYRTERNEARAALATAQARIEQLHRLDIERVAGESLSAPVDFWLSSNSVADYVDPETGLVDIERVREDAKLLVSERPGLSKYLPAVDPTQGTGGGTGKATPSWGALLS